MHSGGRVAYAMGRMSGPFPLVFSLFFAFLHVSSFLSVRKLGQEDMKKRGMRYLSQRDTAMGKAREEMETCMGQRQRNMKNG